MKISYNWLKWYVPELPEAEKLWDVFTFHLCEVESVDKFGDDTIFDINILPNRAHDLLSHQGVAQELSALLSCQLTAMSYKLPETILPTSLKVSIESPKCRRYMSRIVRNVKVGPSPEWVVKHLESIGQRSINNLVDATNIVMFDCGQPCHVFDAAKVKGSRLEVKEAEEGGKIKLLGGEEKDLNKNDLTIQDGEGNILALAGVKGGTLAEVDENTTEIILEVGNFDPVTTRKTGRRLGLFTDALKRFENDLSPVRAEYGMRELSATILEMCPDAEFEEIVDEFPGREKWETKKEIKITTSFINGKLGSNFSDDEIENVWKRMKFEYSRDVESFSIIVPELRLDLVGPHDLAEEVGRIIGYDKIEGKLPEINFKPQINETFYRILTAKKKLTEDGYREVMTYSFRKKGKVEVAYGAKGKEALRANLSDGLKEAYEMNRLNTPLLGTQEVRIFEIGNVFPAKDTEEVHVAFIDKSGVKEMNLEEFTKDIVIGKTYEDVLLKAISYQLSAASFKPWSAFPFISRDIALWVPKDTDSNEVLDLIKGNMGDLVVVGPTLFDEFIKEDKKSLAFRLVFQAFDRTLTDGDVESVIKNITNSLLERGFLVR